MEKVKDLVCGMMIDPQTAAGTSEYKGQTYYFCARGCKVAFDRTRRGTSRLRKKVSATTESAARNARPEGSAVGSLERLH